MDGRISAAAAVANSAGEILVVRQSYGLRRYSLPGGAVDTGESPDEAAIRETREETGLIVKAEGVLGVYRLETGHVIYVFRCSLQDGVVQRPPSEISEVGWFDAGAVPTPVTNTLRYALGDLGSGQRGVVRHELPHL